MAPLPLPANSYSTFSEPSRTTPSPSGGQEPLPSENACTGRLTAVRSVSPENPVRQNSHSVSSAVRRGRPAGRDRGIFRAPGTPGGALRKAPPGGITKTHGVKPRLASWKATFQFWYLGLVDAANPHQEQLAQICPPGCWPDSCLVATVLGYWQDAKSCHQPVRRG